MTSFFLRLLGAEATAAAAITREVGQIEASAAKIGQSVTADPAVVQPPLPELSTVGRMAAQLVKLVGGYAKTIDHYEAVRLDAVENLRQLRVARSGAVAALSAIQDDKTLTDDQRTAINLEIEDHTNDVSAAAIDAGKGNIETPPAPPMPSVAPLETADPVGTQTMGFLARV